MPQHTVSEDLKIFIPALHHDGYEIQQICDILMVKKSLIYKTLAFFLNHVLRLARVETNVDSNDKGQRILEGLLQRSKDAGGFCSDSWQRSVVQEVSKV